MKLRHSLLLGLACSLAVACGGGDGNGTAAANGAEVNAAETRRTIGEGLAEAGGHASFLQMVEAAGLAETLRGAGPYTVFAPTDAAFQALSEEARRNLTAADQRERLTSLLSYHMVSGVVTAEDLGRAIEAAEGGRTELATLSGDNLSVTREGDSIIVGDGAGGRARVTAADQVHANGVVHAIDAVLMPAAD